MRAVDTFLIVALHSFQVIFQMFDYELNVFHTIGLYNDKLNMIGCFLKKKAKQKTTNNFIRIIFCHGKLSLLFWAVSPLFM